MQSLQSVQTQAVVRSGLTVQWLLRLGKSILQEAPETLTTVPTDDASTPSPQPYLGDDTDGFTRTREPIEMLELVLQQDAQTS
jgi:hypothetical protein|eukprot:COSAG02_NODE_24863_length_675_cov_1.614583_1_plen_83_part_00